MGSYSFYWEMCLNEVCHYPIERGISVFAGIQMIESDQSYFFHFLLQTVSLVVSGKVNLFYTIVAFVIFCILIWFTHRATCSDFLGLLLLLFYDIIPYNLYSTCQELCSFCLFIYNLFHIVAIFLVNGP